MDIDNSVLEKINTRRDKKEAAFVFSLWKDPELYANYLAINEGKDETLQDKDAIFYFNLGKAMYLKGYKTFDAISIDTFLENKPNIKEKYEQYGGFHEIDQLERLISPDNIDTYFDEIVKLNTLSMIYKKYHEVYSDVERFNEATSEDIYNTFELLNNSVSLTAGLNESIENLTIDNSFIEKLKAGENVGFNYSKYAPMLNYITLGCAPGSLYMLAGHSGNGKALAIDEPILTPSGFIPMGNIKLGDYVIGGDGKKTKVIGVFPQGKCKAYKVSFEDGTEVICNKDHLWKYKKTGDENRGRDWKVATTEELMNRGVICSGGARRFRVPRQLPIMDFESKGELPLDPYALGLLLGDGCICRKEMQFTTSEPELVQRLNDKINGKGYFKQSSYNPIQYIYHVPKRFDNQLKEILERLGLFGKKSGTKFIPEIYLFASYENRLELIRGLIDTDGFVSIKGGVKYSTTSEQLAKDFQFLANSLGYRSVINTVIREGKSTEYSISIHGATPELYTSTKHKQRYENKIKGTGKKYHHHHLRIINIEELDYEVEMQCIMVDNEDHTYLCRNFTVTHNSSFVFGNMLMGLHHAGVGVAVISNEMDIETYKLLLLEHVLVNELNYYGLTRKQVKIGKYTEEQEEKIHEAQKIINDKYNDIVFVQLFDNRIPKILKYLRRLKAKGIQVVLYDTFKSDDAVETGQIWQSLMLDARKIFQCCSKLGMCCITTYQLALHTTNQRFLDASCLSNSKQIKEIYETMVYTRPLWDDEYPGEKNDVHPYRLNSENNKIKESIELDRDKKYLLFFIDKTRADEDKKVLLYEWNPRFNKWKELGFARVINDHGQSKESKKG